MSSLTNVNNLHPSRDNIIDMLPLPQSMSNLFNETASHHPPWGYQGCILAGISFLSISSILLPTRKSGIRRDKYLSAAIFKEAVHSDDS